MIEPGSKLAHYEVVSALGKGGMGEVWRAKDTKLGREVAIKTLPAEFAQDADRLSRFEREAKLLASLNHPNIAAIHGFEEDNGTHFLVMELVEGDTLAGLLDHGAIPVDESLKFALQIAEALEAAHEKGVIHRDLKPANIKITPDGKVKVLDFGLAKALIGDSPAGNLSQSPTLSLAATNQGVILGTAAYMSPEQARGVEVDKRADIWAYGSVLFEMLTGRQAFKGELMSDVMASVLKSTPDYQGLPPAIHPRIKEVLRRCLEKDPGNRYRDIGDVEYELRSVAANPTRAGSEVGAEFVPPLPQSKLPWAVAGLLGVGVLALAGWSLIESEPAGRVVRFIDQFPDGVGIRGGSGWEIAISPDGERTVYNSTDGLYVRSMDDLEFRLVVDAAENPTWPVFSPDGQEIAYADDDGLKKISINGGASIPVAEVPTELFGISWGSDGTILFGQSDGIWQVSEDGGTPIRVVETAEGEQAFGPRRLPDGESILYTLATGLGETRWDGAAIVIESATTEGRTLVRQGGSDARFVATGHIVYAFEDALYALAFDPARLEETRGPTPVVQGVRRPEADTGAAHYDISQDGTLVYFRGSSQRGLSELVMVDSNGNAQAISDESRVYTRPRVSPDGTRVAVEVETGTASQIWIVDVVTGIGSPFTFEGSSNRHAVWTDDSESIVYRSFGADGTTIYMKSATGTGEAVVIHQTESDVIPTDVHPDGTLLFNLTEGDNDGGDLWTLPLDGNGSPSELLVTEVDERHGRFSPDGDYFAYRSVDSAGDSVVYIRPYPNAGAGGQFLASDNVGGAGAPVWSPDGDALYYVYHPGGTEFLWRLPIQEGSQPGRAEELFAIEGQFQATAETNISPLYDITPDGNRLVFVRPQESTSFGQLGIQTDIVLNWTQELLELVPVD